jgi:hypothetical protein
MQKLAELNAHDDALYAYGANLSSRLTDCGAHGHACARCGLRNILADATRHKQRAYVEHSVVSALRDS